MRFPRWVSESERHCDGGKRQLCGANPDAMRSVPTPRCNASVSMLNICRFNTNRVRPVAGRAVATIEEQLNQRILSHCYRWADEDGAGPQANRNPEGGKHPCWGSSSKSSVKRRPPS